MENKKTVRRDRREIIKTALCGLAVLASLVVLLCFFATFDSSALDVPRYEHDVNETSGLGALDTTDAYNLVNYVQALDTLGYLDTRNFLILARPAGGSTSRIYVSSSIDGQPVIGEGSISVSYSIAVEFYGSERRYYDTIASTSTFPIENVLCYKIGSTFVNNVSNGTYQTGTGKLSQAFTNYIISFVNYANLIREWTGDDYQDGYDAGYTAGQTNGYTAGYGTGYAEGREYGYNEGYEAGYTDGFADGEEEGGGGGASEEDLALAWQEGYEIGYLDGTDYGYEQGYNRALIDATPNEIDVERLITAIPEGVRNVIDESFGFELFGINVAGTLLTILVVSIVAFVVRKLLDSR